MPVLTSNWDGLSRNLIAQLYAVQMDESGNSRVFKPLADGIVVECPISDATVEQTQNWTSPFENQTPDAGVSTFSSMLQVGGFTPILNALQKQTAPGGEANKTLGATKKAAASLIGASSVTKLNSTQVYSGSPPLKLNLTAHFRALSNPVDEVERPLAQLMSWMLPIELSQDGALTNLVNDKSLIRSVYSSRAPTAIAFRYAGKLFSPMVIESISVPLTSPMDVAGNSLHKAVTLSIASLSALDRADWKAVLASK